MEKEKLAIFNAFKNRSISNAEDNLRAAKELVGKGLNHLAYHLAILALEEIGQIFMFWIKINQKDVWGKSNTKIELDNHEMKLFYALWWPSIGSQLITKEQYNDNKKLASTLHQTRLASLYGVVEDKIKCAYKVSDEGVNTIIKFVDASINLSKTHGEVDEDQPSSAEFEWFANYLENPEREKIVFGKTAQEKLIELDGDSNKWIQWLRMLHEEEQQKFTELAENEFKRTLPKDGLEEVKAKWEINFTLKTPSHSIRQNILTNANKTNKPIQLFTGKDNHTLVIKNTLGNNISVNDLWEQGWISCKLFAASLCIGARGVFYWNIPTDLERYFEYIKDLENNQRLTLNLKTKLELNWKSRQMQLSEQSIHLAFIVYEYLSRINNYQETKPITEYLSGLGMLAKTDIHLRLEHTIVSCFYNAFKFAIELHEEIGDGQNVFDIGYTQIEKMIGTKEQFDKTIKLARNIIEENELTESVTLTHVIALKNYCDWYLLTIAVRKQRKDNRLRLIPIDEENPK